MISNWSVTRLSGFLSWSLDLIALGTLALTGEVRPGIWAFVLSLLVLTRLRRIQMGNGWMAGALFLTLCGTFFSWWFLKEPLLLMVAQAAPIFHASLWFSAPTPREKGWRVGIGFVELNLTAAITNDLYLSLAIFLFAILSSILISTLFLESEFKTRAPEQLHRPLSPSYLRNSLMLSAVILLSSFAIFPILPRTKTGMPDLVDQRRVGYTEEVTLAKGFSLTGAGSGSPVIRMFTQMDDAKTANQFFLSSVFAGLLRGRVLSVFDGKDWYNTPQGKREMVPMPYRQRNRNPATEMEEKNQLSVFAIREPIDSVVLPVPYGANRVLLEESGFKTRPMRTSGSEWNEPNSRTRRVSYNFSLSGKSLAIHKSFREDDLPQPVHLMVPDSIRTHGLKKFVKRLFLNETDATTKLGRVMDLFGNGYKATLANTEEEYFNTQNRSLASKLNAIEKFLFVSKAGHCEHFASAAAVLLRMGGVPTRLIAGFRISRGPANGILTVRSGDAHAWLEVWIPREGWKVYDPTPREYVNLSLLDTLRDQYEALSAYWYRYVLSFESNSQIEMGLSVTAPFRKSKGDGQTSRFGQWVRDAFAHYQWLVVGAFVLIVVLGVVGLLVARTWFPGIFSIRWRVREGPWWLRAQRIKLERLLSKKLRESRKTLEFQQSLEQVESKFGHGATHALRSWVQLYNHFRFGPPDEKDLFQKSRELSDLYLQFKNSTADKR